MAKLYLVATPIGNLEDISLRTLRILGQVDLILAERPVTTKKLLNKYKLKTPLWRFHQHSNESVILSVIQRLKKGENLALVSEAGTPGVADPGGKLIKETLQKLNGQVEIIPIPGPSALTAILSVSGFNVNRFLFLGFLPKKRGRKQFLKIISASQFPVVLYESVYRIKKLLGELSDLDIKEIVVGRELTKKFETIYRGSPEEVLSQLKKDKLKGEFAIVINK